MKRIAIAFTAVEAEMLRRGPFAAVLVPPGIAISERPAEAGLAAVTNLNRSTAPGAVVDASCRLSQYIAVWIRRIDRIRLEEVANQNDVYQYHLRLQFYFLRTLEAYLRQNHGIMAIVVARPVPGGYESPMRPEAAFGHDPFDTYAYLAGRLAGKLGIPFEAPAAPWHVRCKRRLLMLCRGTVLKGISLAGALAKIVTRDRMGAEIPPGAVGIIVRTESEVTSALPVIEHLTGAGIPYVMIRDELLASRTTARQLQRLNLPYISIGAGSVRGLAYAISYCWRTGSPRADAVPSPIGDDLADHVLCDPEIWATMGSRLHDFRFLQRQFLFDVVRVIRRRRLGLLVTFCYVDQWGPIIRHAGRAANIATIAVQNAAQDPELYPKLCWATHYCVESHYLKRRLTELGYPANRLTATGLGHFARGLENPARPRWDDSQKMRIAILTQPIYGDYFRAIISVACDVARQTGCEIVIKYHPRQRGNEFDDVAGAAGTGVRITSVHHESLDTVLQDATIAVSVVSAALLRAIFLGVPTFSLLPVEEQHLDLAYVNDPVMSLSRSSDELRVRIISALKGFPAFFEAYGVARRRFLEQHGTFEPTSSPVANVGTVLQRHLRFRTGGAS